jgi:hypothetical protein
MLAAGLWSSSCPAGAEPRTAGPAKPARLEAFPLRDVRLLDGPFQDAQRRGVAYLLRLDPDRLLHTFRRNASLPSTARPYGGWEAPDVELRGHSLGHYLSACALMYEATGDERLKQRALGIVGELRRVQQALAARGMGKGYVSAFPEEFFDRVEARKGVWAPYYTLHKILAGLLDVYRATGDATAIEVAKGMASWVASRAARLGDAQWQAMLETEFGGMQDALTALYAVTRDPEHLRLARLFDHRAVFDPLARGEDPLDGLHANTQIPKAIGAALDCELTGEARYCRVAETFWTSVALHRSYAIGGHSDDEHFPRAGSLSRHLGESTAETCNTYNMLKLTRQLFELEPRGELMDFYERGLLNHVLASQDPASGGVTYYVPLTPGAFRTYSTPEDSFWCCVGTGMENPARYGEAIYSRPAAQTPAGGAGRAGAAGAVYVNLFLASELRWPEQGLVLRQETRFPDEDRTRLTLRLEHPLRLALRLRRPAWAADGLELTVNGDGVGGGAPGEPDGYVTVEREWRDGDVVELRLPMSLRLEPTADDPTVVALLYGPVVLAADLGTAGLEPARRYGPPAPELKLDELPPRPALVAATSADALARVRPAGGPLSFRTEGLARPGDVELQPFFRLHDRRYTVYFDLLDEAAHRARSERAEAARRAAAAIDERTLDRLRAGVAEEEAAHQLEQKGSDSGWLGGRPYRAARGGGGFSYVLRAPVPRGAAVLRVTYWGGEARRHRFEVLVDGTPLATQTLFDDAPGEPFSVEYTLPRQQRKQRIGFRPLPGSSVGAVLELRLVVSPATRAAARSSPATPARGSGSERPSRTAASSAPPPPRR